MCSCVLEEFARICALDTIELTLSQYPTVRQCSVREGGTRFFLCSCNKREDAFEPTMSVTVGHIKVADVTEEFARTCALVSWKNLRAYVLLTQLN